MARILAVIEGRALPAFRSNRPMKRLKPSVPDGVHEVLLREKEKVEKALASLALEKQAIKKSLAWGYEGPLRGVRLNAD